MTTGETVRLEATRDELVSVIKAFRGEADEVERLLAEGFLAGLAYELYLNGAEDWISRLSERGRLLKEGRLPV